MRCKRGRIRLNRYIAECEAKNLLCGGNDRELEHHVLASETAVYGRERVELVLERSGIFRVEEPTVHKSPIVSN